MEIHDAGVQKSRLVLLQGFQAEGDADAAVSVGDLQPVERRVVPDGEHGGNVQSDDRRTDQSEFREGDGGEERTTNADVAEVHFLSKLSAGSSRLEAGSSKR